MAHLIMIQGTMSGAGKSLLTAGLCRVFRQDGYRVLPFKSQNMALNSFVTSDGLEMGRAQVMQAEAAGVPPSVDMNPILLKPTGDTGSQLIVNGEVRGNFSAREYFGMKKGLAADILAAFRRLESRADVIVIEGAGSPAEINLREDDIVNMGLAEMVDAPVLLVGDIDRGGVFAQLYGTAALLRPEERARIRGLVINKFRGDRTLLDPGIRQIEDLTKIPVLGVMPFCPLGLEDEDSLTERFQRREPGNIDLAVIRFPRISNFTDFDVFESFEGVSVRYVAEVSALRDPDLIFLPGSKNTMCDLRWMRETGLCEEVLRRCRAGTPVFGICGGYQMMGSMIRDPHCVEAGGAVRGMGLIPAETVLTEKKVRTRVEGSFGQVPGILSPLSGKRIEGYEIHMGETHAVRPILTIRDRIGGSVRRDGFGERNVYGSYVHGLFDAADAAAVLVSSLAAEKGMPPVSGPEGGRRRWKERQYDALADLIRDSFDMRRVRQIMGL